MKAKFSNFIVLDIGSSKIIGIAAHLDKKGEVRILSQIVNSSEGIKSGIITDLRAAENSIINTIYALEKECDRSIKQVAISLSGAGTKSYYLTHKIKLSNQPIRKEDLKRLIQKAIEEFKIKDQEIIHYFPVEYIVDGNNHISNPTGIIAKEISCQLHVVSVNSGLMTNLINCLSKYQLEITSVTLAVYASGMSCLNKDEKELGAIIIDAGAKTTTLGVFFAGKLIYTSNILIGSSHITADIAKLFSLSISSAEKLKVLYGNAMFGVDRDYPINLEDFENNNDIYNSNSVITTDHLNRIIHYRFEEILSLIKEQYDKAGIDHLIAKRLVITGGGAMLKGTKELAGKIFDKQVRIAKPIVLDGFAEGYNPATYSTAVGIIKNQAERQQKNSSTIDVVDVDSSWIKKTLSWLKQNV
ncbi:MAG: cell division protein FtsA [Rickettsiaceae bacterium]|nr:MAG: cell division protein FtsA [Rickettsiaceae bacterium]